MLRRETSTRRRKGKNGENIILGDDIILTVIEINGGKVRLGVEHPQEVSVHRWEVYEAIRQGEASTSRQGSS